MIEWKRVAELREEVGAEDFEEVVELFLEEVDDVIARLSDAPAAETLEEDLHFLKGSALNLGFATFADLCQDGERRSAAGAAAQVPLTPILDAYRASRKAFLSGLGDLPAAT